jgi:tetratricopeptide (TPR) repeat protein
LFQFAFFWHDLAHFAKFMYKLPPILTKTRFQRFTGCFGFAQIPISLLAIALWSGAPAPVGARSETTEPPPIPAPESSEMAPDPLLPNPPEDGVLPPERRQPLELALDRLNAEAAAQLAAGNGKEAFKLWNRELRLRRYLGPIAEVQALSRVGAIAWQQEELTQVEIVETRLEAIHQEFCPGGQLCDLALLRELGGAFEQVRSRDLAIRVYSKLLGNARQREDIEEIKLNLEKIGQLQVENLDYRAAAPYYEELLAHATARNDREAQIGYIERLIFVYAQGRDRERAIVMRQQLIAHYLNVQDLRKVPQLKVAVGVNYQLLGKLPEAIENYREAYTMAWSLQQFQVAREALQQLADLYYSLEKVDEALQVYEAMLVVDRRATNLYGLMESFDRIGQIQRDRGAYPEALAAFQSALELAQRLDAPTDRFSRQIEEIVRQSAQQ